MEEEMAQKPYYDRPDPWGLILATTGFIGAIALFVFRVFREVPPEEFWIVVGALLILMLIGLDSMRIDRKLKRQ